MKFVHASLLFKLAALGAGTPYTTVPSGIIASGASASTSTGINLTIAVTNSYGNDLFLLFKLDTSTDGSAFPTPVGNPQPTVLPNAASTQYMFPPGWGGNIPIGRSIVGNNSLIEASNNNSQPFIDVSYVDGFSVSITCSSDGTPITGCNIDLFQQQEIICDTEVAGPICNNPARNTPGDQRLASLPRALVLHTRFRMILLLVSAALHMYLAVLGHHVRRYRVSQGLRQPRARVILEI